MTQGLEIAKLFYQEHGAPMLEEKFPQLVSRIAVGLVGEGSECYGFDDEISRDHDYGPSFCMWLTDEDFAEYGVALQDAYHALPSEFMGLPARKATAGGTGRVGALQTSAFYRHLTGLPKPPETNLEWLRANEYSLAVVTNGRVFRDDLGAFTAIRNKLKAYYPEDVRRKKIAACATRMAQSGQYNYARSMRRGETGAAFLMLSSFVENCLHMFYLLDGAYMPFLKWAFRGLADLKPLPQARRELLKLTSLPMDLSVWPQDDPMKYAYALNTEDKRVELIERICADVIKELENQHLSSAGSDFLLPHAVEITRTIQDDKLARMDMLDA